MPTVLCSHCTRPTILPDPWCSLGYTCPHCGASVTLTPPAPAPESAPTVPAAPSPVPQVVYVHHRDATTRADHLGSAFSTMLGGSLGCFAAIVLICFGIIALGSWGSKSSPTPYSPPSPARSR